MGAGDGAEGGDEDGEREAVRQGHAKQTGPAAAVDRQVVVEDHRAGADEEEEERADRLGDERG